MKRVIAVVLLAVMLVSLSACSFGGGEVKTLAKGNYDVNDISEAPYFREGSDTIIEMPTLWYASCGNDNEKYGENAALAQQSWTKQNLPFNTETTAIVVMHAAYIGQPEEAPNQFAYCEYLERSYRLAEENFPAVLDAARAAGIKIYHVPFAYPDQLEPYAGYQEVQAMGVEAPTSNSRKYANTKDPIWTELGLFKQDYVQPGPGGWASISEERGKYLDFIPEAIPQGNEPVCMNSNELGAVAERDGISTFVYMGFAIDTCLLSAECGMIEMNKRGFLCSAILDCVTAVESKDSVLNLMNTEVALWRIARDYGFIYEVEDLVAAFELLKK